MTMRVLVRKGAAAVEVAVALEPSPGDCGGLARPARPGLGVGGDRQRLDRPDGACGVTASPNARARRPPVRSGSRYSTCSNVSPPAERLPGDPGRGPEGDDAGAGGEEREPRAGPAERCRLANRRETESSAGEPVPPDRPRLRVLGGRGGDVCRLELEDRGEAGDRRRGRRREIAGRWCSVPQGLELFRHEDRSLGVADRAVERASDVVAAEHVQGDPSQSARAHLVLEQEHRLAAETAAAEVLEDLDRVDEGSLVAEVAVALGEPQVADPLAAVGVLEGEEELTRRGEALGQQVLPVVLGLGTAPPPRGSRPGSTMSRA